MSFFSGLTNPAFNPVLVHEPVMLRPARETDYEVWADLREQSRAHLTQWEENWTPKQVSRSAFIRRLKGHDKEMRRGGGLYLLSFRTADNVLVGGATLSNIRYGAARSGILGYWVGAPHVRQGYGAAAVTALIAHAFDRIGLNRIIAACQPDNAASHQLLKNCRFRNEGLAREYLKINGHWRDHAIFALTAAEFSDSEA